MTLAQQLGAADIALLVATIFLGTVIIKRYIVAKRYVALSRSLKGPPSKSRIFGLMHEIRRSQDPGRVYEDWGAQYGGVYAVPSLFGQENLVLLDPKAVGHFLANDTTLYVVTPSMKKFIARIFGRGLLWAEGESHRRQKKALTPAFSNVALRRLTSVFYDSAHKLRTYWDNELENQNDGAIIEVQSWMNRVSLDSIGIAGFSHDFGSLDGKPSAVVDAFEAIGKAPQTKFGLIILVLSFVFSWMLYIPTERSRLLMKMRLAIQEIATEMLEKSKKVTETNGGTDNSIIGLLIKAEGVGEQGENNLHLTPEEVAAQMNVLLVAGYETTSISLTWALIELSKSPEKQDLLRKELLSSSGGQDPEWDDLMSVEKFPYLDAVVHEVLRLHPPVPETTKIAAEANVLPLSAPIVTKDGKEVTCLPVPKGTVITCSFACLNRSESIWGERAKEFIPERWISGNHGFGETEIIPDSAKAIQGHRHLLTFSDGPRMCLGKNFALSEFKAVLIVLIKNYIFEFPDGPGTKISLARAFLPRPKVEGALGPVVSLRVRKFEME